MKTLLKNGTVVNVFTDSLQRADVLLEDGYILGVGDYAAEDADTVEDITGKTVCPGLIDGHIHIESTMLTPAELARVCLPHGTTTLIADPHEIANVLGMDGVRYMQEAARQLPMDIFYTAPSCVPATEFDEAGAELGADEIRRLYSEAAGAENGSVIGLGEMMNYPGVLAGAPEVMAKLAASRQAGKVINGHAPGLSGPELDRYIAAGIYDDHECSSAAEAMEKLEKGMWIMIRQGTAARNLEALLPLFREPFSRRCLLATDDKHPADLLENGHIDAILRQAAALGAPLLTALRMATLQAAQRFGLADRGAVAPGYRADLLVLDSLEDFTVRDVYHRGRRVAAAGKVDESFLAGAAPADDALLGKTLHSFHLPELTEADFTIAPRAGECRVIRVLPGELITREERFTPDFAVNGGADPARDICRLAVVERHRNTGHIGLGFIAGLGLREGAIASSVAHDSHNLIVAGVSSADMAAAANRVRELNGGLCVVRDGKVLAELPLPVAGLMSPGSAEEVAEQNRRVREAAELLGHAEGIEPFMHLAFVSLPVIPALKMTTRGLFDVVRWRPVPLFPAEEN